LLLRAGGAVEGDRGDIEFDDIKPLKDLKDIKEPYRVLIRSLIASGFKERSDESLEIASI
jgi:hypothetical protein